MRISYTGGSLNNNNANNANGVVPDCEKSQIQVAKAKAVHLAQGMAVLPRKSERQAHDAGGLRAGPAICMRMPMKENYYDKAMSYDQMHKALKRVCRNVRWKDSVVGFEWNGPANICKLQDEVAGGRYVISEYQHFKVWEPKERDITATRIRDRLVQMSFCEAGLLEDITEHFIRDNCACQPGKGVDFALDRMTAHLRRYYQKHGSEGWVLKCDIHHYFPETPHETAKAAMRKRISDPEALKMVEQVIDSFEGDKGIGLGSQFAQLIELAVLDDLDHYIKEKLRVKHYIRYMDDFVLIHEDKEFLRRCLAEIRERVEALGLQLNQKTTMYPLRQGVKFLQWRFIVTDTGRILRIMPAKKTKRIRKRLKRLVEKEKAGEFPPGTAQQSFESWRANARRGDTKRIVRNMAVYYSGLKGVCNGIDRNARKAAQG